MNKPHKHAAIIKAWADGAEIQFLSTKGEWLNVDHPGWHPNFEYRVNPEPKPDVPKYTYIGVHTTLQNIWDTPGYGDNLKLTFDGETGKLKTVEVLPTT